MQVFVRELLFAELIKKEWLEEVYPEAELHTVLSILNQAIQSQSGFVYGVFGRDKKDICGFFWGEGNLLDKSLFLNTIYVCKELRKNPKIIGTVLDFLKNNFESWGFKRILFLTKKPNFYLKRGCTLFEESCIQLEAATCHNKPSQNS